MKAQCGAVKFSEKLFNQDPQNINSYFSDLNQAVKGFDAELIEIILKQMSQAKYSKSLNPITPKLIDAVDNYMLENPVEDLKGLNSNVDMLFEIRELGLDISFNDLMKQSVLQTIYVSNLNMPSLSPLIKACEQYQKNKQNCQPIADILIENSDTLIMVSIGYGLNEKINEVFGDDKSYKASQQAKLSYTEYQKCLVKNYQKLNHANYVYDSDSVKIMTQGKHEGANFELSAVYLYEKYKDDTAEELIDPKSCGLRYIESD